MDCQITVLDADGVPIQGVNVALDSSQNVTGFDGGVRLVTHVTTYNTLIASHPDFVPEHIHFDGSIATGKYDNALLQRTVTSPQMVLLKVHLGRCQVVPTIFFQTDQEVAAIKDNKDPRTGAIIQGAIIQPIDGVRAYRSQSLPVRDVDLAETPLAPTSRPTAGDMGWDKFSSSVAKVDLQKAGRFYWLSYGQQTDSKGNEKGWAVLVWSPNIKQSKTLDKMDIILFYSPSTDKYLNKYPFGVTSNAAHPASPRQRYMLQGARYTQYESGFAYDLVGRQRTAVMIMPICNQGKWGPFAYGEGGFRLCREVLLFLHRECRTSDLSLSSVGGVDPQIIRAGGSLRSPGIGYRSSNFGKPPRPGRLVISFFSSGSAPAKSVMSNWLLPQANPQTKTEAIGKIWGCSDQDPKAAFAKSWQEIWDMDGFHSNTTGATWEVYLARLNTWVFRDSTRMVRLCHSSGRQPQRPSANAASNTATVWKRLVAEGVTVLPQQDPDLREIQGQRWAAVAINNSYFEIPAKAKPPLQFPEIAVVPPAHPNTLDDAAHQVTPRVAFSYFLILSPVGT